MLKGRSALAASWRPSASPPWSDCSADRLAPTSRARPFRSTAAGVRH